MVFAFLKMLVNKDARENVIYMHNAFKSDKNYTLSNFIKSNSEVLNGRRIKNNMFTFGVPAFSSKAFKSFISTSKSKDNVFSDLMLNRKSAPDIFSLAVTGKCTNNCTYCSAQGRKSAEELTCDEWIKTITQIQDMGSCIIEFTGGEPLLRNDLERIIGAVDERSQTLVATSGAGLTEKRAQSLKNAGLFGVIISLDSFDENKNDNNRGKGSYKTSVAAIKNAINAGLYTVVSSVIPKNDVTLENIYKICEFVEKLGADELLMVKPIMAGKLNMQKENGDIFYDDATLEKLNLIYKKAIRKFKRINIFASSLMEWEKSSGCIGGIQMSYINFTGELFPCDFLPLSFGNVKTENLNDIWQRMNEVMGNPKRKCMCKTLIDELKNNELPIDKQKSTELCMKICDNEYPDFYKRFLSRCN